MTTPNSKRPQAWTLVLCLSSALDCFMVIAMAAVAQIMIHRPQMKMQEC